MLRIGIVALALGLAAVSTAASAKVKGPTLRDQQQAACYDDVMRLCKDAVPDEAKVAACMEPKRAQVSAKCAAMWDVQ